METVMDLVLMYMSTGVYLVLIVAGLAVYSVKKIKRRKVLILIIVTPLIPVLLWLYSVGLLTYPYKYALPYQTCGGSTLKSKECIAGYKCKSNFPGGCEGCGGMCVKIK